MSIDKQMSTHCVLFSAWELTYVGPKGVGRTIEAFDDQDYSIVFILRKSCQ